MSAAKPTDRTSAESQAENLARYKLGGFGANANATLGVKVKYPTDIPQGVTILDFEIDSEAEKAGIAANDIILEVDCSPVGFIRGRYYELWPKYGRSGKTTTEVLVTFLKSGERMYYYLPVKTSAVTGVIYAPLPEDFFTEAKPKTRIDAEDRAHNVARYVFGYGNFSKYARFELGANVTYSAQAGGTIAAIKTGGSAATVGLKVGDHVLEVDGAPVGQFGDRLYEIWRQYLYSKDGTVELLIAFDDPATGRPRYYYPKVKLSDLSASS
jgi:C-terminal processing protease CtpA/Prc